MQANSSSLNILNCFMSRENVYVFTGFFISYILQLPVFILVLHVGYQRWRKQPSVSRAAISNHTDIFTFNIVVVELIGLLGSCFYCYGNSTNQQSVALVGLYILSIISAGETLFHLMTCVERYLAVVHPITYVGLRQAGGVRIRNISIGCVWLLCFGLICLQIFIVQLFTIIYSCLLFFLFLVVSFCTLSILCALIRSGPKDMVSKRESVDQSKQRAFHTLLAITGALLLRFLCNLVTAIVHSLSVLSCSLIFSSFWFSLPSSLVLPLLFLNRAGKLPGCKDNTVSA